MNLSVVLPCYNEEANIEASVRDVDTWFSARNHAGSIIVADDGSTDGSLALLMRLKQSLPRLQIVHLEKNGGYGIAVRAGCDSATTEWIAFMDSDGQFHAKDFDLLLPLCGEFGFVTGRRGKRADSFLRNTFGKILGGMNVLMLGLWVRDVNCGMKIFRRDVWQKIRPTQGIEKLFNTEMFLRLKRQGIAWGQVNVPHYPRTAGTPTGGSVKVILRMFKELWGLKWNV